MLVPMKTIAVISQKGGAGKTTLAVHLAVAATAVGQAVAVIDLDPQASATSWKDLRAEETPPVVTTPVSRLAQVLETAAEHGAILAIIDTAPHSEAAALAAARSADLILIPCRPAILDLKAIGLTVDLATLAGKPARVVFNAVPARGTLADEAATAVASYQVPIAPVRIGQRAAYVHALTRGQTAQEYEPESKAAAEIKRLYKWTCKQVGL
jgi:chromosome partitioning protein